MCACGKGRLSSSARSHDDSNEKCFIGFTCSTYLSLQGDKSTKKRDRNYRVRWEVNKNLLPKSGAKVGMKSRQTN